MKVLKLGIVGLPNVGKSTLFNSLTKAGAESAKYPFSTVDRNIGVVTVPDERLQKLDEIYHAKKITPAVIEFVDIAGLVSGASKGEGLGNQFLAYIREVDAIVHVVRCFEDENVVHVHPDIDPMRDIETIDFELIFADLEVIERRLAKSSKPGKGEKTIQNEAEVLKKLKADLESGICARKMSFNDDEEAEFVKSLNLLTYKPVLYAANEHENDLENGGANNKMVADIRNLAVKENSEVFTVCAKIEEEIVDFDPEEKTLFLKELGVEESGLDKLISASYKLLGLISFLTAGPKEVRAWTITEGTKAPQAAGKIHSDIERGFIRAEIVNYHDLIRLGTYTAAKENGLVRLEGKEYVIKDGDVVLFRFNV